jgi:pyruvate kinase
MKKTKIVATIGLASEQENILREMMEAGMNVARLNFSHGTYEWHGKVIDRIRKISADLNKPVAILADLQGPRIRTLVSADLLLVKGAKIAVSDSGYFSIDNFEQGILLDVPKIIDCLKINNEILIEDGLIKIKVLEKKADQLIAEVIDEGTVKNHKGVNIPDAQLPLGTLTEKDEKDLEFVLSKEVDFVGLSFVSCANDIFDLKYRMRQQLQRDFNLPHVVAKIERKEAVKNLDEIINATDAVMVARGDLGIEFEGTKVVILQKEIIKKSLSYMKPVIVATQMLNSMIENPRPTRAEVSDVTNAVIDHADAVMLSGESASGKYPVESVRTMADIIKDTEASPYDDVKRELETNLDSWRVDLMRSAYILAKSSKAKGVILGSASGLTARLMSHFRPTQPIFAATDNEMTYRQLALVWGVYPRICKQGGVFREDIDWLLEQLLVENIFQSGERVILVTGQMTGGERMRLIGVKELE